ncbi:MAG: glycerophosphodiester phosphodiesterase [Vulcanimicrobiota bacterium]
MPRTDKPPVIIGHRGHALALENTLQSFHESVDMGAAMLELDVRLSKDGIPVVFHDNSLNRITGRKSGSISSRTSVFLTQIDLGSGQRISTLDNALKELIPRIPVNIEMKFNHLHYRPLVFAVIEVIQKNNAQDKVLVSSFFHQSLEILNRNAPHIPTAPLFGRATGPPHDDDLKRLSRSRKNWINALPFEHPAAVLAWDTIDAAMVKRFKQHKLSLLTYTVDNPEDMERLWALGVDGIITNRPDLLGAVLYKG